jgi:hypothetical protein
MFLASPPSPPLLFARPPHQPCRLAAAVDALSRMANTDLPILLLRWYSGAHVHKVNESMITTVATGSHVGRTQGNTKS